MKHRQRKEEPRSIVVSPASKKSKETRNLELQISRVMLSGAPDVQSRIRAMKTKVDSLNEEKAFLMTENNF